MTEAGAKPEPSWTCATVACHVSHVLLFCCRWGCRRLQILLQACSMAATQPSEVVLDQVGPAQDTQL